MGLMCLAAAGSINTIATKFQVRHWRACDGGPCSAHSATCSSWHLVLQDLTVTGETTSGEKITFNHPAVQSSFMFLGEVMCLVPYFILRWRKQLRKKRERAAMPAAVHRLGGQDTAKRKPYTHTWKTACAFALPAVCDAAATTLLNLGLYYTDASGEGLLLKYKPQDIVLCSGSGLRTTPSLLELSAAWQAAAALPSSAPLAVRELGCLRGACSCHCRNLVLQCSRC